jgi:hypothetical protein
MKIENEAAGMVIGKGGSKVGEIRKISGAQVICFSLRISICVCRCTYRQKRSRPLKEREL